MRAEGRGRLARAVLVAGVIACAATAARAQDGVEIEAGAITYERQGSVLEASGGVKARWDGNSLVADRVRYERDADRLLAEGGVRLETPGTLIRAESCELFIDAETGTLHEVEVELTDDAARFGGSTVQKLSGKRFVLSDGYFTTCRVEGDEAPDWSLTGARTEVEVDGYGRIRGAAFRVRGVPVLYAPVLVFPAITRRQSGLLAPRIGASDERGFIYSQPYFWAIDKHRDLTVTGDLESARRVGLALEYRYRPDRDVAGEVELRYYNEAIRTDKETDVVSPLFKPNEGEHTPENRVIFSGSHRQRLDDDLQLYADALLVSDDLVLRETDSVETGYFARSVRRTRRYTDSRVGAIGEERAPGQGFASWGYRAAYFQDLVGAGRYTLQEPGRLWTTVDGDLGLGFSYLVDGEFAAFYRDQGNDGERFDVAATVERPLLAGRSPVRSSAWGRARFTGYHIDNRALRDLTPPSPPDDTDEGEFIDRLDPFAARVVGEAGIDLRTGFVRSYRQRRPPEPASELDTAPAGTVAPREGPGSWPFGERFQAIPSEPGIWGAGKFRHRFSAVHHTLEPFAGLRFTSDSEDDDLPRYDAVDRIDGRTTGTYGIASRFMFTEAESGRTAELARFSLAQTYNIDDEVIDDHFSDVDATLAIRPVRNVSFAGLASYNVGTSALQGAAATLSLDRIELPYTDTPRTEVAAAYHLVRGGAVDTAVDGLETLAARTILALTENFAVGLNGRYDFVSDEFVESGGGFRIESSCRCWTIDIGVVNRVNPNETQFRLQVELGGIGSLGSSALEYQSPGLAGFDYGVTSARRYGW